MMCFVEVDVWACGGIGLYLGSVDDNADNDDDFCDAAG